MVEIAFVLAPGQNLFFVELVEMLVSEIALAGGRASVHVGGYPEPMQGRVYALVPPHEYFTILDGRIGPPPEVHARTLMICAEQPGTSWFTGNLMLAPSAGALFDINRRAVREFMAEGFEASHLQLGYTERWALGASDGELDCAERDIDVLFMGSNTKRRHEILAHMAPYLARRRTQLLFSDLSRPVWQATGGYVHDAKKWQLLRRAKVLLNVHQGDDPYFEWLRIVQALLNGCVVVSEHSTDFEPLAAGEHFLAGGSQSLGMLLDLVLDDAALRTGIQRRAFETLRDELPMSRVAAQLIAAATDLDCAPVPDRMHPFFLQPQPVASELKLLDPPRKLITLKQTPAESAMSQALKDVKLELLDLRRRMSDSTSETGQDDQATVFEVSRTAAYDAARPAVSVLVSLYNYADYIEQALQSTHESTLRDWEIIVVDDASSDDSRERTLGWLQARQNDAVLVLANRVNRGLPCTRNTALAHARGHYCFILDADNEIFPHCLERLSNALDADAGAAFAYGIHEVFRPGASIRLEGIFPWDPQRLALGNYIDAMAMIRTTVLRRMDGYTTDRRLYGWEDYDLWCRMAGLSERAVFVPEIVARYRDSPGSMIGTTNLSTAAAYAALSERTPRLFADVEL